MAYAEIKDPTPTLGADQGQIAGPFPAPNCVNEVEGRPARPRLGWILRRGPPIFRCPRLFRIFAFRPQWRCRRCHPHPYCNSFRMRPAA